MPVCHLITHRFLPHPGGLENSVFRIACLIASLPGWTALVYVRSEENNPGSCNLPSDIKVFRIGSLTAEFMAPLGQVDLFHPERFRIDFLQLRNQIEDNLRIGSGPHVLLSFYISHTGFLAQNIASSLGLAHIACIRGTDFSRDCFDPGLREAVAFVVSKAHRIVTTNEEQRRFVATALDGHDRVVTIYNSVEVEGRWHRALQSSRIRLIADCGYSFKKGTHILLSAALFLKSSGISGNLVLCGRTEAAEKAYWNDVRRNTMHSDEEVTFLDVIDRTQLRELLLSTDIYCSATLGEGCSQGRSAALLLGMPIVSTRCGELTDLARNCRHIYLSAPGDSAGFAENLIRMCHAIREADFCIDDGAISNARLMLNVSRERKQWTALLSTIK